MKRHLTTLILSACMALAGHAQSLDTLPPITGAEINTAADTILAVDASAAHPKARQITFAEAWKAFGGTNVSTTELGYLDGVTSPIQTQFTAKEAGLGNPGSNGYVLSSTTGGTRSWIAPATGNLTSGPVTATSGVSSIADGALAIAKTSGLQTALDGKSAAGDPRFAPTQNLKHLYDKVYRSSVALEQTPITWLTTGDSVAGSKPTPVLNRMRHLYGENGYALGSLQPALGGSATASTTDFTLSPSGVSYTIPSGSNVSFGVSVAGVSTEFPATLLKIKYAAVSGGGTFKIQTNLAGAGWVDETTVVTTQGAASISSGLTNIPASNATTFIGTATVTKSLGRYLVRAVGVSGTVKILGASMRNTGIGGVYDVGLSQGGVSVSSSEMGATPQTLMTELLYDIDPTVVSLETKDTAAIFTSDLDAWYSKFTTACPNADWVDILTSPTSANESVGIAQTVVQKQKATALNHFVFDATEVLQSYAAFAGISGWSGDGTHLSAAASEFQSAALLNRMGILGLVSPTTLIQRRNTGGGPYTFLQMDGDRATTTSLKIAGDPDQDVGIYLGNIAGGEPGNQLVSLKRIRSGNGALALTTNGGLGFTIDTTTWITTIGYSGNPFTVAADGSASSPGNFTTTAVGKTLAVKSGTNALAGTVTLTAGAGTISSTAIDANTVINITLKTVSGTVGGQPYVSAITAGTSATLSGGGGSNNSTYNWVAEKVN
ncbi:MAG: hypothetical protein ABIT37_05830 [Luteolibacter sp.]